MVASQLEATSSFASRSRALLCATGAPTWVGRVGRDTGIPIASGESGLEDLYLTVTDRRNSSSLAVAESVHGRARSSQGDAMAKW